MGSRYLGPDWLREGRGCTGIEWDVLPKMWSHSLQFRCQSFRASTADDQSLIRNGACGERNGNPLQYSCLENPRDRGAWWAAVHRVAQSRTQLKRLSMHACIGEGNGNPLQYSCLENPRDRGAWWAAVYRIPQIRTRLK